MSDTDAMVDAAREAELKWLMETADLREQLRVAKEGLEKYADEFGDYWLYDGKEWGASNTAGLYHRPRSSRPSGRIEKRNSRLNFNRLLLTFLHNVPWRTKCCDNDKRGNCFLQSKILTAAAVAL